MKMTEVLPPPPGFESSCNQSVFNFFLLGLHVLVLFFSFANIVYFMWLTLFDLILL